MFHILPTQNLLLPNPPSKSRVPDPVAAPLEPPDRVPERPRRCAFPPAVDARSSLQPPPAASATPVAPRLFLSSHPVCTQVSPYGFDLRFPDDEWCRASFLYLLAICVPFWGKCLFRSFACSFNWVFTSLLLDYKSCLYSVGTKSVSDVWFANVSSHSVCVPFPGVAWSIKVFDFDCLIHLFSPLWFHALLAS